jgi:hypothetical protein
LESETDDYPSQYLGSIHNVPKRNSYQSFGDSMQYKKGNLNLVDVNEHMQINKNAKRYPTFGTKKMLNNDNFNRIQDFGKKKNESNIPVKIEHELKPSEMFNPSESPEQRNLLLEMFNKRVKEVKSINATERNARLIKSPGKSPFKNEQYQNKGQIGQRPQPENKKQQNYPSNEDFNKEIYSQNETKSNEKKEVLYRKDPVPSSPIKHLKKMTSKLNNPKLRSLGSRVKEIMDPKEEIIQLMRLDTRGKVELNPKALEYISKLDKDVKIVSVIGPYRSGKSFLLNRLNGHQKGFHIGNSTNPCTQGVWLWGINTGSF